MDKGAQNYQNVKATIKGHVKIMTGRKMTTDTQKHAKKLPQRDTRWLQIGKWKKAKHQVIHIKACK